MKVKLTQAQKIRLANSTDVYTIMRDILLRERRIDRSKEHFWLVCLANNNKLLLIELVSFGSATATIVEPTEVFSFALQKKAAKLIMVHNHPSGDLKPSFRDKELTERMAAIGKFVRVPVIDHLIVTEEHYYSFADSGLLDKIMNESHYDLTFSQIDRLKAEMKFIEKKAEKEKKKAEKEKAAAIAKERKEAEIETQIKVMETKRELALKLLRKGVPVGEVASLTGLPKKEVEKLKK